LQPLLFYCHSIIWWVQLWRLKKSMYEFLFEVQFFFNFFTILLEFILHFSCHFNNLDSIPVKGFSLFTKVFFFLGFFIYFPINIVTLIACLIFSFRFYWILAKLASAIQLLWLQPHRCLNFKS
jgi:hypothetical protein